MLSATVIDPTAIGQSSNISLTPGAQTYIYGEETGGEYPCGPFANGSGETLEDTNGVVAAGLAVSTQPTNSFSTNASYYTISGVGVSGYTNMQALYGRYVVSGSGEENSGSYEVSVSFNLTQSALVVAMGLGSSQQEIMFQGPTGLVTDAAVSGSGNGIPITAGIAHVVLSPGNYTIQETTAVTSIGQTLDNMVDLLGVYIFTGSASVVVPAAAITTPSGTQNGNVTINYTLADADSDPCSILAQYSADGGTNWNTATLGGGDGTTGLTSSPAGTSHSLVWASLTDLPNVSNSDVEFRITPSSTSGTGSAATTAAFAVNNIAAPNWVYTAIGATASLGPASLNGTTWTLSGSSGSIQAGQLDFESQSEAVQPSGFLVNGGYTISAYISPPTGNSSAVAGIAMVSGLSAGSPFVSLYVTGQGLIAYSYSQGAGGPVTSGSESATGNAPADPVQLLIVVRAGTASLYYRPNGALLATRIKFFDTGLNSLSIPWATTNSETSAGMFVSSGDPGTTSTGTFTNVTIDTSATNGSGVGTEADLNIAWQDLASLPAEFSTVVGNLTAVPVQATESAIEQALSNISIYSTTLVGGITSSLADTIENLNVDGQTIAQMVAQAEAGTAEPITTTGIGVKGDFVVPLLPPLTVVPIGPVPVPVEANLTFSVEDDVKLLLPLGSNPELVIAGDYSVKLNAGIGLNPNQIFETPQWDLSVEATPPQLTPLADQPLGSNDSLTFSVGAEAEADIGPVSADWQYTIASWTPFAIPSGSNTFKLLPPQGLVQFTTSFGIGGDQVFPSFLLSVFGQAQLSGQFEVPLTGTTQAVISTSSVAAVAGQPLPPIAVTLEDALGNVETDDDSSVTLSVAPDPVLYGTTTVNAVDGVATFDNLYLDTSGNYSFVATDATDGITTIVYPSPVTVAASKATHLAFIEGPSDTTAGNAISPAVMVAVEDQYGNIVTTNNSRINLNLIGGPWGAFLLGTANLQVQNGVATFKDLSILKAGDYSLKATDRGLASATSNLFAVTPGPAVQMQFVNQFPWLDSSGNTFNVQVALFDQYDNLATNDNSTVTLSLGTHPKYGALSGVLTTPVVKGIADFDNLSVNEEGLYSLVASDSGGIPAVTSWPFLVGNWKFDRDWACPESRV